MMRRLTRLATPAVSALLLALVALAACATDDGLETATSPGFTQHLEEQYTFIYPDAWTVTATTASELMALRAQHIALEHHLDGAEAPEAWLSAIFPSDMRRIEDAISWYGADPNDWAVHGWEQVEASFPGADRAAIQRYTVADQYGDGVDYHYRFVAVEPTSGHGAFALTIGVRDGAGMTVDDVEELILGSLSFEPGLG